MWAGISTYMQYKARGRKRREGQEMGARTNFSLFLLQRAKILKSDQASQIVIKVCLSGRRKEPFFYGC